MLIEITRREYDYTALGALGNHEQGLARLTEPVVSFLHLFQGTRPQSQKSALAFRPGRRVGLSLLVRLLLNGLRRLVGKL